jgi:hypothetical protein
MKHLPPCSASFWRRNGIALSVAAALFLSGAVSVQAFVFTLGDVNGNFDTTISIGVTDRLENPDPNLYGLTDTFNGIPGKAYSVNDDDGDLNYKKGIVAEMIKVTHDLDIKWGDFDYFARGYYFIDPLNENSTRPHTPLSQLAKDQVGANAVLLDNYVTGKFEVGSMPLTLRAGRQVISWGESTFIPNGINVINPIDVARLRSPGAELREALLPVYAIDATLAVTDKLSIEAVGLLEFRSTEIDPDGTYFSTNDFASPGGKNVFLDFGALPDNGTQGGGIPRGKDHNPSNFGQWGLAMHYLASGLNNTDFGLYYLRYDSRLPVISAVTPTAGISPAYVQGVAGQLATENLAPVMIGYGYPAAGVPAALQTLLGAAFTNVPASLLPAALQPFYPSAQKIVAGAEAEGLLNAAATGSYFVEYPKDIDMFGASFNTDLGRTGISLQGEISYKKNVPFQVDDVELLFATLSALDAPGVPPFGSNNQLGNYAGQFDTYIQGYRRLNVWQAQATATKVFGPMLGASQLTIVGEVGAVDVPDLPSKETLRFDGYGTDTAGNPAEMINTGFGAFPATPSSMFPDKFSWGYQAVGKLDYNNLFAGINVSPSLGFAHDVNGNTPLPMGNFVHDRKTLTVGVDFVLQNKWSFEMRYVNYFGGRTANLLSDRDFVSATLKYSF